MCAINSLGLNETDLHVLLIVQVKMKLATFKNKWEFYMVG